MMRAFVVAPAQVQAQTFGWYAIERVIQGGNVHLCAFAKFGERQVCVLNMPSHGEVGAIELQIESRVDDRLVFVAHRIRYGE